MRSMRVQHMLSFMLTTVKERNMHTSVEII